MILYLQGKPLTLAEHTLLQAKKFLDAFRAVISKQEETSQCPDLIKLKGNDFLCLGDQPEAMGPPSLTHGWLRDHYYWPRGAEDSPKVLVKSTSKHLGPLHGVSCNFGELLNLSLTEFLPL